VHFFNFFLGCRASQKYFLIYFLTLNHLATTVPSKLVCFIISVTIALMLHFIIRLYLWIELSSPQNFFFEWFKILFLCNTNDNKFYIIESVHTFTHELIMMRSLFQLSSTHSDSLWLPCRTQSQGQRPSARTSSWRGRGRVRHQPTNLRPSSSHHQQGICPISVRENPLT